MLTFNQIYDEVQTQVSDSDASSLIVIKRAINQGMRKFGAVLNRDWRVIEMTFSTVASQQYYQLPENCIRVKTLTVTIGDITYPLELIEDDETWQLLNMRTQTTSIPQFFFVKGSDQIGIWPIPSTSVTGGGTARFEPYVRDMSQDDYTTGTIAVASASQDVVGTGTTFTADMVGRTLFVTDGSGDGMGYKVTAFTDATHISLENDYRGITGTGKSYSIGEVPDIPAEFHESLIDYACYRYYLRRRDMNTANEMKSLFEEALTLCQETYSSKTSSQYVRAPHVRSGYTYFNRDLKVT